MSTTLLTSHQVAKRNIEEHEDLFAIPRSAALQSSALPSYIRHANSSIEDDPWASLLLALLYEHAQAKRGNSIWKPYLDVLPTESDFDTLMFWTDEELDELQASAVRSKIGKKEAEDMFRTKILPVVRSSKIAFGFDEFDDSDINQLETELFRRSHILASTIMAYAFDIEPPASERNVDDDGFVSDEDDDALPKGMIPLADTLNADADRNNAKLFYDADGMLVMRAIKPIACGKEIFNDYGPLPRSDLLRRYGYISENYKQYDIVEIPTQIFIDAVAEIGGEDKDLITFKVSS